MKKQISSVEEPIIGSFRGEKAIHYYDPVSGIDTIVDENGNYIAGWKLSQTQIEWLLKNGNIQ